MINNSVVISVDAMGGDNAPYSVISGISIFAKKRENVYFKLFGNKEVLKKLLNHHKHLRNRYEIIHTEEILGNDWKVADALRKGKNTSMWLAIQEVADKKADAVVSAGNTGALMALSRLLLKMLPGIDRPAIINYVPTKKNPFVFLDLGANSSCTPEILLQFAIMGDAFAKAVLEIDSPKIALLNIGSEELKGNPVVQDTAKLLSEHSNILNYVGFIEGDQLFNGEVDVVITDGFSGNIALKVIEGTAKFISYILKNQLKSSIFAKLGFLFLIPSLLSLRRKIDTRRYNGAMLIGLNGISVKSHGSSDKIAFESALEAVYKLSVGQVNKKIQEELKL